MQDTNWDGRDDYEPGEVFGYVREGEDPVTAGRRLLQELADRQEAKRRWLFAKHCQSQYP